MLQNLNKTLRKSLNPAFLKQKPTREAVDRFDQQLAQMLANCQEKESEEYHKNLVIELFKHHFDQSCFINTKGRNDLVIHNGAKNSDSVGVIIEAKRPSNRAEMLTVHNLNAKATQELLLYFLRERITHQNLAIKHLIITNVYEWFVLDAQVFDRCFAQDKKLVKQFQEFEQKQLVGDTTDFFYKEIAKPAIDKVADQLEFTYFDLRDSKTREDHIALFKFFSPQHLLKQNVANDSNTLDKGFYNELLHLIGLTEVKEGGKKLIQRLPETQRNPASLLENTLTQLKERDKINQKNQADGGFDTALELVITWVNRVLFLKLLEAQLMSYHKESERDYAFLNSQKITDYYQLNRLFFQVLAKKTNERNTNVSAFARVPYLNSSLFEESPLEKNVFSIDALDAHQSLPLHSSTVLKDAHGKRRQGSLPTLAYLFEFLEAYDFSSEGSEDFAQEQKTLINASVLGLIFEKLNGYRDGSFFTPGFITMYMCRETLRRAVVQKFNECKNWSCESLGDIYNRLDSSKQARDEANEIVNSIKVCDPAVGSGHFLVSALNELIAIKHELGILQSADGKRLKDYSFEVHNDELVITDEDGKLFQYKPNSAESQRVQQTLFHEKQTLIERCLFGVDINPNSVKICRLRLWIELLKNAYYKTGTNELETLPNIDINIKCGNSLVSRFKLNADLKQALKKSSWDIETYQHAVKAYQNAKDKQAKREAQDLIDKIQGEFQQEMYNAHWKQIELNNKRAELDKLTQQDELFERTDKQQAAWEKQVKQKLAQIAEIEAELHDLKEGVLYQNAFEWRYEFPEVLNAAGDFVGFDVVIGNPPYIGIEDIDWEYRRFYESIYRETAKGRFDLYSLFIDLSSQLKNRLATFAFIVPGKFLNNKQFVSSRHVLCQSSGVLVAKIDEKVFSEAQVDSAIVMSFSEKLKTYRSVKLSDNSIVSLSEVALDKILESQELIFRLEFFEETDKLIAKIENQSVKVKTIAEVKDGIVAGSIKDILFVDHKKDNDCHPIYFGKNVSKYALSETDVWVDYKPEQMMQIEVERKKDKRPGLWMRNRGIFDREKILSRFVAKEIIATYDPDGLFYDHTLHGTHVTNQNVKTKFVLALFNSTLFRFYYRQTNSEGGNLFPQVRISSVENLPIRIADENTQQMIESLVSQILTAKQTNPDADTQDLEHQIDQLVYQLYSLTPEEIALVEEQVGAK